MQKLKAMRERIANGETEIQVVLQDLAERLELKGEKLARFEKLMEAEAYLESTMFLAINDLDNGAVDIAVSYRSVPTAGSYGKSHICGPSDDSGATAKSPEYALCAAYIKAKIDRMELYGEARS